MKKIIKLCVLGMVPLTLISCNSSDSESLDDKIQKLSLRPIQKPPQDKNIVKLGQMLYFDRLLSGNKDTSCATCHHPYFGTSDNRSLPIGVDATGLGPDRKMTYPHEIVARNAPEVFNRGDKEWKSMFWDSRIQLKEDGTIDSPAKDQLPEGLNNVVSAQALFPLTARAEMRGFIGENDIANLDDSDFIGIWNKVLERIKSVPGYIDLLKKAYPDVPLENITIAHIANAIGAFEIQAFSLTNSPWDKYLAGDKEALTPKQKLGAEIFYGKGNCYKCHAGALMTDQKFHNIGVPQFGPGKDPVTGLDYGRYSITKDEKDKFKFRTPPLRNVAYSGPYFHNGAYSSIKDVIKHHMNPEESLRNYDLKNIPEDLRDTYKGSPEVINEILSTLDPELKNIEELTPEEFDALVDFVENALTDPDVNYLSIWIPESVPSGLPVDK